VWLVVFDWFFREGWMVFSWWLLVTLAGVAALPLCTRLLGALPDRGYTLARAAGLLFTGYVFWILGSLGFLRNTGGSIILSWLVVLSIGITIYLRGGERFDWRAWWRENRTVVIVGELLFIALFVGWAIIRAYQPELHSTEKPMDLMFISSIMRSPAFPPNDGWMAGYSISYYYFGYFIAAMLGTVSGIASTITFNLTISLVFALTGFTAFGVAYNLVRARQIERAISSARAAILVGVVATIMVVLMGNFHTALIDIPYDAGMMSDSYLKFWDVQWFNSPPPPPNPNYNGTIQWFWPSRILKDYDLDGTEIGVQPIDEFPQFSFLLADNHPHVMGLPYVLLALGLGVNLVLRKRRPTFGEIIFYGLCIGALVFLNTWDGPIYMLALVGADGLRRVINRQGRLAQSDFFGMAGLLAALVVLAGIFYLPFLISFRSQASGFLPNLITPTYFPQFFLMFGPFLLILIFFLLNEIRLGRLRMNWLLAAQTVLTLFVGLLAVVLVLIVIALRVPEIYDGVMQFGQRFGGLDKVLPLIAERRWVTLPTTLFLLAMLIIIVARVFPRRQKFVEGDVDQEARQVVTYSPSTGIALVMVALAVGLTLVPEFFYLRDNFGVRINTIFKFYYQAWVLFSIASAYAVYALVFDAETRPSLVVQVAFSAVVIIGVGCGLLYPILGNYTHSIVETGRANSDTVTTPLTLDGARTLVTANDYQSIMCWQSQLGDKSVIVAELSDGAYNNPIVNARVSGLTGVPDVLGWSNHERQWRGTTYDEAAGSRQADLDTLYKDMRWESAQTIIQQYGIAYIFYGDSERQKYGSAGEEKFIDHLQPVCSVSNDNGQAASVFYRVDSAALVKSES
jgi:YYY domain-containing protein